MGLETCADVRGTDVISLVRNLGKFGQSLWERSHGIDERLINPERLRKSVGVERTLAGRY
ncbi:DNA polymerase IV [Proteus mirabilis]|uniref:DNA polymerase IV n=1 Tax=Proteus mirabilis TaxID=584 RepID=A0A2X2E0W4_PROMI|nr:DNA polymerase IV [Proteus mirabilis]